MSTPENKPSPTKEALVTSLNFSKKTLSDYEVISAIGNGTFGTCFKIRDKETGQIYAWKVIQYVELNETYKKSLGSEIKVLRQLQHPNIVQYFHHLVNYETKSIFIIMEYCEGGDLAQLIAKAKLGKKRFEERYIWRVLYQVCRALRVCHNKVKECIILHRDIKPANIFLDTRGNAKLGDFGLARLLRRSETFADTFVGTPYYMSPEIINGSKYDRKSDVWAVGCLIYEMCSLRPPFNGAEFNQLSMNISTGKFSSIPDIYSTDLQEIIEYTLEVKSEHRPCIELLFRHPLLMGNIYQLENDFPVLVGIESQQQDFCVEPRKLEYSPLQNVSSTIFKEQNSFNEEYGQRLLSITGIFTPDLKSELFYSARRKIFPFNTKLQLSDPELYESIRGEDISASIDTGPFKQDTREKNATHFKHMCEPYEVTRHVFNIILQERLKAIKAHESLLKQREESLNVREQQLIDKEKRLIAFEERLGAQSHLFKKDCSKQTDILALPNRTNEMLLMPLPKEKQNLSNVPVPTENPTKHDDTYCSIESNDTSLLQQPTMAKLNMASLPTLKVFPSLRKVTFQSPKKIFTHRTKNKKQKTSAEPGNNINQIHSSTSSKSSQQFSESAAASSSSSASTTKRKSILSIFGLHRANKENKNLSSSSENAKTVAATAVKEMIKEQKDQHSHKQEDHLISKCETVELSNIWTREHKKAAFEMLAAMNAAKSSNNGSLSNAQRHKIRQSVRDRNSLQRSCLRRSLNVVPVPPILNSKQRDQIFI